MGQKQANGMIPGKHLGQHELTGLRYISATLWLEKEKQFATEKLGAIFTLTEILLINRIHIIILTDVLFVFKNNGNASEQ